MTGRDIKEGLKSRLDPLALAPLDNPLLPFLSTGQDAPQPPSCAMLLISVCIIALLRHRFADVVVDTQIESNGGSARHSLTRFSSWSVAWGYPPSSKSFSAALMTLSMTCR